MCTYLFLLAVWSRSVTALTIKLNNDLACGDEPCGIHGYREGRCSECDCCPRCWSCAELLHYPCRQRNGFTTTVVEVVRESVNVGDDVTWNLFENDPNPNPLPSSGWSQCAAIPSLPPGLTMGDNGVVHGVIQSDPSRPRSYNVNFFAFNTLNWQRNMTVLRLELRFTVNENVRDNHHDNEERQAARRADSLVHKAFQAYSRWDREKTDANYEAAVRDMKYHLTSLRAELGARPRLGNPPGMLWMWLGGLHMNIHKLMQNVLYECETYLGAALLFPDENVRREAGESLDGCYAKRQLEAAKFLWQDGLRHLVGGEWAQARAKFELAQDKKDGWGWGVNNGDIWTALAATLVMQWVTAESDTATLEAARNTLDKALEREAGLRWTRYVHSMIGRFADIGRTKAKNADELDASETSEADAYALRTRRFARNALKYSQTGPRPDSFPELPKTWDRAFVSTPAADFCLNGDYAYENYGQCCAHGNIVKEGHQQPCNAARSRLSRQEL